MLQLRPSLAGLSLEQIEAAIGPSPTLRLFSGLPPVDCLAPDPSGLLVQVATLPDWMLNQVNDHKDFIGPWSGVSTAAGTALCFRLVSGGTCWMQGDVGTLASNAALKMRTVVIPLGRLVRITQFTLRDLTYQAPGGDYVSADFLTMASDPVSYTVGYSQFVRLPNDDGLVFGGNSHDSYGNNSVRTFDPMAGPLGAWTVRIPHTPVAGSGAQNFSGKAHLINRDNHCMMVVDDREVWVMRGESAQATAGGRRGIIDIDNWSWAYIDDNNPVNAAWPRTTGGHTGQSAYSPTPMTDQENAAFGRLGNTNKYYWYGGTEGGGGTVDWLHTFTRDGAKLVMNEAGMNPTYWDIPTRQWNSKDLPDGVMGITNANRLSGDWSDNRGVFYGSWVDAAGVVQGNSAFGQLTSTTQLAETDPPQEMTGDISTLVRKWIDTRYGNRGLMLRLGTPRRLLSRNHANSALRPWLEVDGVRHECIADADIDWGSEALLGAEDHFDITPGENEVQKAALQFDLTGIPPTFVSATLHIWCSICNFASNTGTKMFMLEPPRHFDAVVYERKVAGIQAFNGARKLRYISNQHFSRNGYVYVYGGTDWTTGVSVSSNVLWRLDINDPPQQIAFATNTLPTAQQVKGEAILAVYDAVNDEVVITNGIIVNVYKFATDAWVYVPVNTPPDPRRESPNLSQGGGRAAFFSTRLGRMVILGSSQAVFNLRLNRSLGAGGNAPSAVVTGTTSVVSGTAVPDAGGGAATASGATVPIGTAPIGGAPFIPGPLNVTTTTISYPTIATGAPFNVTILGSSKHLQFGFIGNRHYKMVGDHAAISPGSPSPQGGRQEIFSFDPLTNTWTLDQEFFIPDPQGLGLVQQRWPDDAYCCERGDEIYVISNNTNQEKANAVIPGYATQIWGSLMAFRPSTGLWRIVAPLITECLAGNKSWGMAHDPVSDRFIVPMVDTAQRFIMFDGNGVDLTHRTSGVAKNYGDYAFHVAGMAINPADRAGYVYDMQKMQLFRVNLDPLINNTAGALTLLATLPDTAQAPSGQARVVWHPALRTVVVCSSRMHAWQVDTQQLTSWGPATVLEQTPALPYGYFAPPSASFPTGHWIRPSDFFYDPLTQDIFGIGTIDFADGTTSSVYWRLHIY